MISDIDEETLDLDWFSVDMNGEIAHFTSGGRGFLPLSAKASKENLDCLTAYFRLESPKHGDGFESPNLCFQMRSMRFRSEAAKAMYPDCYLQMGSKGLYSFDCIDRPIRPSGYFMVARPSHALRIEELPFNIKKVLQKTRFRGQFATLDVVQADEFT